MKDEESLKPGTVIRELPDPIQAKIYDLLPNCVVAIGEVVDSVFFFGDELLRVEELTVGADSHFIDDSRL